MGLYRDDGKENAKYYVIYGLYRDCSFCSCLPPMTWCCGTSLLVSVPACLFGMTCLGCNVGTSIASNIMVLDPLFCVISLGHLN